MKRIHFLTAATAVLIAFAGIAIAQTIKPTASPAVEDDCAIRKVLADYDVAWNTHNMKALDKVFREDAEFINVVGMHWRGRADIIAAHAAYHATILRMSK